MDKGGQFFLIAAFVIVIIFSGLSYIYTSANVSEGKDFIYDLGDEILYEGNQLIDKNAFDGVASTDIADKINSIIYDFYSRTYPFIDMVFVYGDSSAAYIIRDGSKTDVTPTAGKASIELNGITHEVDLNIKSFHVILDRSDKNEKVVVVK